LEPLQATNIKSASPREVSYSTPIRAVEDPALGILLPPTMYPTKRTIPALAALLLRK
jgi:hypothetical protein